MKSDIWQSEARKLGGEHLVQVIEDIRDGQLKMISRLDEMEKRHTNSETSIAALRNAFPSDGEGNRDYEGHRRWHDTMIRMLEERRRLRVAIQEKTLSGLIWGGLVFLGMAAWHEFLAAIGRGS